ncbi:MAG: hypothetical protein ISQ26_09790 [Candidatus Puniceispirillum sp.]|nr:hypothetical protein [Candidatus Puniceispirillum sp.]
MLKHVGRMVQNQRRIVVAYKTLPNDADHCVVVTTENLEAADHDSLIKLVESPAGQEAEDLATVMARTKLSDGSTMLARFHTTGKMVKVATKDVEMVPNSNTTILLSELNEVIAQQKGVSVSDLAVKGPETLASVSDVPSTATSDTSSPDVLDDAALAAKYRSDADRLYKEAKQLREMAEELVPTTKKSKAKSTQSA